MTLLTGSAGKRRFLWPTRTKRGAIVKRQCALQLLAVVISSALALPAGAAVFEFGAILTGANEVPAVETAGNGEALVLFDDQTGDLTWNLIFQDLSSPVGGAGPTAHIHSGSAGTNGPVVIPLDGDGAVIIGNDKTEGIYLGAVNTNVIQDGASIVMDLFNGDLYFNLHTTNNPSGEIRGQILPGFVTVVPVPPAVGLFGSALGLLVWIRRRAI